MPISTRSVVTIILLQLLTVGFGNSAIAETIAETDTVGLQDKKEAAPALSHSVADEKRLLRRLGDIKTVTSNFVQKLYTVESNKPQITEGKLIVAGGDKFRLEYTKPYEQLYVANGKEFLFYDVDLEQITIKPQTKELANTPTMILSNPVAFVKKYFIKSNFESGEEEYILSARSETSAYSKILLSFKNGQLKTMLIEDSFGQETELNFKNIIYNKKIPNDRFNFIPPEGVDVIRSTPPSKKKNN